MLILRLFMILAALLLVISSGMYVFTKNRRYLHFAWQVIRLVVLVVLVFGLLLVLERYVLIGWRIMG